MFENSVNSGKGCSKSVLFVIFQLKIAVLRMMPVFLEEEFLESFLPKKKDSFYGSLLSLKYLSTMPAHLFQASFALDD